MHDLDTYKNLSKGSGKKSSGKKAAKSPSSKPKATKPKRLQKPKKATVADPGFLKGGL